MVQFSTAVFTLVLVALVKAEGEPGTVAQEVSRGGWSQQYHYNAVPGHHDATYAGLSFDLSTGLVLAVGAIIILVGLCAVIGPWGKGDHGWGSTYASYRNLNLNTESILSGIEKLYEAYNEHTKKQ